MGISSGWGRVACPRPSLASDCLKLPLYDKLALTFRTHWRFEIVSDELVKWRSEFPILDQTVYLISHSLGAMPKNTYQRLHDYADTWATRGVRAWAEGW